MKNPNSHPAPRFEPATEDDIPEITGVMARAFDDDSRRFRGIDKGGPPGYDNGDFLRQWMPVGKAYKVIEAGRIAGCFIVFTDNPASGENWLGTIFIDPEFQDRGTGAQAMEFVHESFPARVWRLETPDWATRNHHFYEKFGYRKIVEHPVEDMISFVYERVTGTEG
ncbi:MAG: GNAT family N-acetyltransferase [Dehalococcoidia bacterium]|nr:GNAT family N-acetyltransferase [Dehalococcoidia bacterium]